MRNIQIGRYGACEAKELTTGKGFAGWISGEDETGRGWIMWLDEVGRPVVFFGNRASSGSVLEPCVHLVDPPTEPAHHAAEPAPAE